MSPVSRSSCIAVMAAACWLLGGCDAVGSVVTVSPIERSLAETYARMSSGTSLATVSVVSSRLSTYGRERPHGSRRAPDAQVWVVVLSGTFPFGTCRMEFPPVASARPAKACPTPAPRERVLIDARSGETIETIPGG